MYGTTSSRYPELTREEWELVRRLREVPEGTVRCELQELLEDLVDFVRDPRCAEAQADGVPCLSLGIACEECRQVAGVLARLHRRLRQA